MKTSERQMEKQQQQQQNSSEETSSGLFHGFVTHKSLFIEQTLQDIFNHDESECSLPISVCFHSRFLPRRHKLCRRVHHIPSSPIHGAKKSLSPLIKKIPNKVVSAVPITKITYIIQLQKTETSYLKWGWFILWFVDIKYPFS